MPVAVVTGASRGFGLAVVRALAERGWESIVDARDGAALEAAIAGIPGATSVPGDVADPAHRDAIARAAAARGRVDLLVNNASTLGPSPRPPLAGYPLDALRRVYEVNVLAALGMAQALLPLLRPHGAIVNVTSDAGREAYEGWGGYGSSKAALDQVTAILAAEHPELFVYSFDPGDMRTVMHQEAFPGEDISDRADPADVAPLLVRLVDDGLPSGRYAAAELAAGVAL
ncbi:MAG TPA: SDR family oxidoreductase [Actinomycetota bacterium]|nr:SDR family oxidoreductase [Actinomycetota bacterium]